MVERSRLGQLLSGLAWLFGVLVVVGALPVVFVSYGGLTSNCTTVGGNCATGETIAFAANAGFGYRFSCGNHGFNWSFGDGGTSTLQNPSHTYGQAGDYTVVSVPLRFEAAELTGRGIETVVSPAAAITTTSRSRVSTRSSPPPGPRPPSDLF